MSQIIEIDIVGDRSGSIRRAMGRAVRDAIESLGGDLAGFAMVSWDMRGLVVSSFMADDGPIAHSYMPHFVEQALSRQLAVILAQSEEDSEVV